MKTKILLLTLLALSAFSTKAQEIQTLFRGTYSHGGYGAISNKFTTIRGDYANLTEVYGGWFINHKFMLGIAAAATTNNLRVPEQYNVRPGVAMSYAYGQFGMMTEYVLWSNRLVHANLNLMTGAGFTLQYDRFGNYENDDWRRYPRDENWFMVMEPGVQVEVNLLRWMRFSPGVSYRKTFGSDGLGMSDGDLSNLSYNVTLKFGKF